MESDVKVPLAKGDLASSETIPGFLLGRGFEKRNRRQWPFFRPQAVDPSRPPRKQLGPTHRGKSQEPKANQRLKEPIAEDVRNECS